MSWPFCFNIEPTVATRSIGFNTQAAARPLDLNLRSQLYLRAGPYASSPLVSSSARLALVAVRWQARLVLTVLRSRCAGYARPSLSCRWHFHAGSNASREQPGVTEEQTVCAFVFRRVRDYSSRIPRSRYVPVRRNFAVCCVFGVSKNQ